MQLLKLWRISEHRSLDGAGGLHAGGRWNRIGRPIVYTAESSALALLESLVRRSGPHLPPPYQLLEIVAPGNLDVTHWPVDQDHRDKLLTADWGDAFLRANHAPLARVPSAVAPESWNYLLNPLHPDAARIELVHAARWPWDTRLFGASTAR
ncbi:MAG TPA: RES family NAD+ phosphorylase [Sphingomonas sp.]|uniref:RES family NAD+ phosphorylase n=1 Tax=Sphingomonas sp. TaxID=28214 RepID=UPI002ED96631